MKGTKAGGTRHKHGTVSQDAKGHKIETGFGKDDSDIGGGERYPDFKGGPRNLSHTLSGGSTSEN